MSFARAKASFVHYRDPLPSPAYCTSAAATSSSSTAPPVPFLASDTSFAGPSDVLPHPKTATRASLSIATSLYLRAGERTRPRRGVSSRTGGKLGKDRKRFPGRVSFSRCDSLSLCLSRISISIPPSPAGSVPKLHRPSSPSLRARSSAMHSYHPPLHLPQGSGPIPLPHASPSCVFGASLANAPRPFLAGSWRHVSSGLSGQACSPRDRDDGGGAERAVEVEYPLPCLWPSFAGRLRGSYISLTMSFTHCSSASHVPTATSIAGSPSYPPALHPRIVATVVAAYESRRPHLACAQSPKRFIHMLIRPYAGVPHSLVPANSSVCPRSPPANATPYPFAAPLSP
ncbi:hypothetical protein C8F01DRAFT_753319 [Mycena amicta]|nr:hypothetical protein C8F01DRAFT_753319 [Mycena amicta]